MIFPARRDSPGFFCCPGREAEHSAQADTASVNKKQHFFDNIDEKYELNTQNYPTCIDDIPLQEHNTKQQI